MTEFAYDPKEEGLHGGLIEEIDAAIQYLHMDQRIKDLLLTFKEMLQNDSLRH